MVNSKTLSTFALSNEKRNTMTTILSHKEHVFGKVTTFVEKYAYKFGAPLYRYGTITNGIPFIVSQDLRTKPSKNILSQL